MQLMFELDSMKSSKEIWTTCREYAEFYTEPRRRIQEEPDPQSKYTVWPQIFGGPNFAVFAVNEQTMYN